LVDDASPKRRKQVIEQERMFECASCGHIVVVEFGKDVGGPKALAYDDYAKCKHCGEEYTNQAQIDDLVTANHKTSN
jgi:transcription elongation factor Elf1